MGAFGAGLVSGIDQSNQFRNQRDQIKMQKDYYATLQKKMDLEMQMQQKQLQGQQDLVKSLFAPPQQMPAQVHGPGAPVQLPLEESDAFLQTMREQPSGRWLQEVQERGPGAFKEGPQPTGVADVPGTGGPLAHASPELQQTFRAMLDATGGDMGKTLSTLQMLAPGAFPQQPMFQKLGEGETLQRINPQTGQADVLASGGPKYRAPVAVREGGSLVDPMTGQVMFTSPKTEKPDKPVVIPSGGMLVTPEGTTIATNEKPEKAPNLKGDIQEVNGVPMQIVEKDGQKTLQPIPGTPEAAGKSPTNPVDQNIFARSGGKYRNMAEAAAAGQTQLMADAEREVRETRPMERAQAQADIMTKAMAGREREAEKIKQEQPLAPKERSNLFSRKAFMESGKLEGLPAGISKGEAARADVIELSDKQLGEIQALDNAIMDMNTLFKEADKLITAKTWKEAKFKQSVLLHGGALSGANADAATYKADVEAFSTNLARAFGHEKGVMTDQDIRRWLATLVTFGDTVQTKEKKKSIFQEIASNAVKAQRRVMAGDDLMRVRAELRQTIEPALRKADEAVGNGAPPPPPSVPKEHHDAYQQAYLEAMEQMGDVPNNINPELMQ